MYRINFLILIVLIITSCNRYKDDQGSLYLDRTNQLLDNQIGEVLFNIQIEYLANPTLGAESYYKAEFIHTRSELHQNYFVLDTLTQPYKIALLEAFRDDIDSLYLHDPYINELKENHIDYWLEKKVIEAKDNNAIVLDYKLLELYVLNTIYQSIRSNYYNFNVLRPIVIDSAGSVSAGEVYEALICFTAFDTTRMPEIIIDGEALRMSESGYGILRYKSNKPGEKLFKGEMLFPNNNREIDTFKFEKKIQIK